MTSPNIIQATNIENILEAHLWNEVALIEERVALLNTEITLLLARKEKLTKIAEVAEILEPI